MKQLSAYLISFLFCVSSVAQVSPPRANPFGNTGGSDYYVGLDKGKPLIRVNVLSGVNTPGVYHIPIGTNISELISYAGGANSNADLADIQIRSKTKGGEFSARKVNLDGLMSDKSKLPALSDQDVIYISQKEGLDNTIKWLTMASLAASIISAIVVISDDDD